MISFSGDAIFVSESGLQGSITNTGSITGGKTGIGGGGRLFESGTDLRYAGEGAGTAG